MPADSPELEGLQRSRSTGDVLRMPIAWARTYLKTMWLACVRPAALVDHAPGTLSSLVFLGIATVVTTAVYIALWPGDPLDYALPEWLRSVKRGLGVVGVWLVLPFLAFAWVAVTSLLPYAAFRLARSTVTFRTHLDFAAYMSAGPGLLLSVVFVALAWTLEASGYVVAVVLVLAYLVLVAAPAMLQRPAHVGLQ